MTCPQQSKTDDCGVFAMVFASQMVDTAFLNLIQAKHTIEYRFYLALCVIEEKMSGVLHVQ